MNLVRHLRPLRLAALCLTLWAAVVPVDGADTPEARSALAEAVWVPAKPGAVPSEYADGEPFVSATLRVHGGTIAVLLPDGRTPVPRPAILRWIGDAADALSAYYGRFPVGQATIVVLTGKPGRIGAGMTLHGRLIRVALGQDCTQADLDADWVITHEMVHLGFPDLDERHLWMEEGLATYLEPVARARIGHLGAEKVWGDLVEGLPKGQPQAGDRGLDNTPTWGRTYWGGAGFWLLVDLHLRERTAGRKSLQDVLRGVLDAGGDGAAHWTVDHLIDVAQRVTGTDVLGDLYQRMGPQPLPIDLPALWQDLGVDGEPGSVRFRDLARLAGYRAAITAKP